jgi:hypothetical protein
MNKRGFELALSTIVVIILAVMVLLFAVIFFTKGSESFLDAVKGYFSYSNVDSIIERCNIFADSNSVNGFCCEKIEVKYYIDDEKEKGMFNCRELSGKDFTNSRIKIFDCKEIVC